MTEVKLSTGEYLLVEVPKSATNFSIIESHSYFKSPRVEHSIGGVDLPSTDQWEIIGRASELTEDDWEDIYGNVIPIIDESEYKQDGITTTYTHKVRLITHTESGLSLVKSHSINPETTLVIRKIK